MNRNTGKISRTVKAKNDQHSKNSASKERNTGKVSTDSDSEGPLSITFTIYTQNFVPTYARGGPASHFSQFSVLCVVTSKYVSTWVPDYPNVGLHVSITFLVCVNLPTWGFRTPHQGR